MTRLSRIAATALCILPLAGCSAPPAHDHPNIVLIVADDQGYGDFGIAANSHIRTPRLDALAQRSVRFERFYVAPVCAPTRAGLLTGRYHQRTGVRSVTNGYEMLHPDETTLAEVLRAEGYRTGLFGKWHLGEYYPSVPHAQGFDTYTGFRTGHIDTYVDPLLDTNDSQSLFSGHITDVLTDQAIAFIRSARNRPFFCYLAYNAPHTPLLAVDSLLQGYTRRGLPDRTARVYALIEQIDTGVGRLLDELEELDLDEQTIVLYLSDNGPINGGREWRYNGGLRDQKFSVYEGGVRTRFLLRWGSRYPAGHTTQQVGGYVDILPTLLDLTGIRLPDSLAVDGVSLAPVLKQPEATWNRTLFHHFRLPGNGPLDTPHPGSVVVTDRYKLVDGRQLYDLLADPGERFDIGDALPDTVDALRTRFERWWQDVNERGFERLPVPVGHRQENPVSIAPHHAEVFGNLQFFGYRGYLGDRVGRHPSGVDGDWITNWRAPADSAVWRLDVAAQGRYRISLGVRVPPEEEGTRLEVRIGGETLGEALPSTANSFEWQVWDAGEVLLDKGPTVLRIGFGGGPGNGAISVGRVVMHRLD